MEQGQNRTRAAVKEAVHRAKITAWLRSQLHLLLITHDPCDGGRGRAEYGRNPCQRRVTRLTQAGDIIVSLQNSHPC